MKEEPEEFEELPIIEEDFIAPLKMEMVPFVDDNIEQPGSHHSLPSSIVYESMIQYTVPVLTESSSAPISVTEEPMGELNITQDNL